MRKDTSSADSTLPQSASKPDTRRTGVYFDHTAILGGGEIALLNLLRQIDRSRWIVLVVLGAEGPLADKLRQSGIEVHVLALDADVAHTRKDSLSGADAVGRRQVTASLLYVLRLSRFLRQHGAHILHTNSLKADILGALAGRLAGVPVLWHVRDRITDEYLPPRAARAFRLACRVLPHAIAVNSRSTLETLRLPRGYQVSVVYSGFDTSRLVSLGNARVSVVHDGFVEPQSTSIGCGGDQPCIGLVGRISPWKGQHIFIQAAALVREQFPKARFQIIGSAMFGEEEYEAQVRQMVRDLEVSDVLEFTGFRADVFECIAALDILAHASTMGEPFGQVVMEGMAAEKPVVATRGGGVPEIVLEGETGLLVPMSDAEAMADAISWLLRYPERAREMGQAGRRRVQEHFTIAQTATKIESLYLYLESSRQKRIWISRALNVAALALLGLATWRRTRR